MLGLLFTLAVVYFGARFFMRGTRDPMAHMAIVAVGIVLAVGAFQSLFASCPGNG